MYKLPNGKIVYPEDIQCVHDPINGKGGIFIGNLQAAENLQTLKKHGIKAILTAAKGVFLNHPKTQIPYQLYIPGQDHEKFDMTKFYNQSITFIRDALEKTNILVHCLAGVSRSVSLVMAYFIKFHNMSYDNVYSKIKGRRKIIHPNDGFITQLRRFESQCREKGPVVQRSETFELRSSYSPSKRYDRKGFGDYEASPQKIYESPERRYNRNTNEFRYTQFDKTDRYNNINMSSINNSVRNPELYKSIAQNLRNTNNNEKFYKEQNTIGAIGEYSPDRQERIHMVQSSLGYKRASMNVDFDRPIQNNVNNIKSNNYYKGYENVNLRGRISSDYKPLDSIQNREQDINAQIDRKIAEIRKKYQQYTKHSTSSISISNNDNQRLKLQRKYTHVTSSTLQQNQNSFNFQDLKMRKISSYNNNEEVYSMARKDNYMKMDQGERLNVGNRLRRLQSYQV